MDLRGKMLVQAARSPAVSPLDRAGQKWRCGRAALTLNDRERNGAAIRMTRRSAALFATRYGNRNAGLPMELPK